MEISKLLDSAVAVAAMPPESAPTIFDLAMLLSALDIEWRRLRFRPGGKALAWALGQHEGALALILALREASGHPEWEGRLDRIEPMDVLGGLRRAQGVLGRVVRATVKQQAGRLEVDGGLLSERAAFGLVAYPGPAPDRSPPGWELRAAAGFLSYAACRGEISGAPCLADSGTLERALVVVLWCIEHLSEGSQASRVASASRACRRARERAAEDLAAGRPHPFDPDPLTLPIPLVSRPCRKDGTP